LKWLLILGFWALPEGIWPQIWERHVANQFGRGQETYRPASPDEMTRLRLQAAQFPPPEARLWDPRPTYLVEPSPERGWGLLWRRKPQSGWVLEVPHPVADKNTSELAWMLFEELPWDALILGGCHRHNRADGQSDLAHTEHSAFMAWHQALAPQSRVILQLHGFDASKERAGTTRPMPPELHYVVADGSGAEPEAGPARQLFEQLGPTPWPGRLAGRASPWLMATRNAQRQQLSGAQFVHLELDARLRQSEQLKETSRILSLALRPLMTSP